MTEMIKVTELPDFDMAEHLKSDEDIANYLTLVLEENDATEFTVLGSPLIKGGRTDAHVSAKIRHPNASLHALHRV